MAATPAPACIKALRDATTRWPNRNRASDGIMGDPRHLARKSDHNLGNAFDLTHDPANGVNCHTLSRQAMKDGRVKYIIFNRQIWNPLRADEGWRKYTGTNPHTIHMHVSINTQHRNNLQAWPWSTSAGLTERNPNLLQKGSKGDKVRQLQSLLKAHFDETLKVDGDFGPITEKTVKQFQAKHKLKVDGLVGPAGETMLKLLELNQAKTVPAVVEIVEEPEQPKQVPKPYKVVPKPQGERYQTMKPVTGSNATADRYEALELLEAYRNIDPIEVVQAFYRRYLERYPSHQEVFDVLRDYDDWDLEVVKAVREDIEALSK